jgi:transposase
MVSCWQKFAATGDCSMSPDQATGPHDGRLPDEWWERLQPRLPSRKPPPLGCHRPRGDARQALEAMFFVRRTGGPWKALHETARCASRAAHRRCHEGTAAGVFLAWWPSSLGAYAAWKGLDGEGLAMDGALTNAPRGGENGGQASDRPREDRHHTARPHRRRRHPPWPRRGRRPSP